MLFIKNKLPVLLALAVGGFTLLAGCSADKVITLDRVGIEANESEPDADYLTEADTLDSNMAWEKTDQATVDSANDNSAKQLYVHVCGAVANPGVVLLPEGSRVNDALILAGGFDEGADEDYINLAEYVHDGQKLYFPYLNDEKSHLYEADNAGINVRTGDYDYSGSSGLVNINTAGADLLCTVPGIGKTKASAIIAYRKQNGRFESKEDLKRVSGIGDSVYETLEAYICVD